MNLILSKVPYHPRSTKKNDGSFDLWINSPDSWQELKKHFEALCPEIVTGWESKREQQTKDEFDAAEDIETEELDKP